MSNRTNQSVDDLSPFDVRPYDIIYNIVALLLVGFVGLIGNVFILFVIAKFKDLQTPCFLLIAGECLCSISIAGGFFENALEELVQFTGLLSETRTRSWCMLTKTVWISWGIVASTMITAVISLDRLISILKPLRYRKFGKKYAFAVLGFCYGFTTVAALSGMATDGTPGYEIRSEISCVVFFSPLTPTYLKFYGFYNLFFAALCVTLYGIMLITFEWRRRRTITPSSTDRTNQAYMKQQMSCMPTIKLMAVFYLFTAALPEVALAVMTASDTFRPYFPRFFYYAGVIRASASLAELFGLGLGSRQFRRCAATLMRRAIGRSKQQAAVSRTRAAACRMISTFDEKVQAKRLPQITT